MTSQDNEMTDNFYFDRNKALSELLQCTSRIETILSYVFADEIREEDKAVAARWEDWRNRKRIRLASLTEYRKLGLGGMYAATLTHEGIKPDDVAGMTDKELLDIDGLGAKKLKAIREWQENKR
jgi:predicted flap endonuclease-1-like 5' DNA nuclease